MKHELITNTDSIEVMYRYEDMLESYNHLSPKIRVILLKYFVKRHTPKGKWIDMGFGDEKFVLNDSKKRFAHETKEDAIQSFIKRKERQKRILSSQLEHAIDALEIAQKLKGEKS